MKRATCWSAWTDLRDRRPFKMIPRWIMDIMDAIIKCVFNYRCMSASHSVVFKRIEFFINESNIYRRETKACCAIHVRNRCFWDDGVSNSKAALALVWTDWSGVQCCFWLKAKVMPELRKAVSIFVRQGGGKKSPLSQTMHPSLDCSAKVHII